MNRLASYTVNPSLQHVTALKRILRYLAGTKNLGITYSKTADNPDNNIFHGFADAGFANHDDHKSTSGYVFLAAGGAITWKSKNQTTIALSSTQAKYVALSEAACKACWLQSLFDSSDTHRNILCLSKVIMTAQSRWPKINNSITTANTLLSDGTGLGNSSSKI